MEKKFSKNSNLLSHLIWIQASSKGTWTRLEVFEIQNSKRRFETLETAHAKTIVLNMVQPYLDPYRARSADDGLIASW